MAKAVPLHQSQGHVQVAVQPDPRPMPTRQAQGQVQLMQPLPQPLYPPQQQLIAVPPRQQAQQLAAPPGLGTNQETKSSGTYSTNGARTGIIASTTASNTATSSIETIISFSRRLGLGPVTRRPMAWLWLAQLG